MPKDFLRSRKYRTQALPLCLHCLKPHDPLLHYCPNCQAAVGQLTPNIPFVNIAYQAEFWGGLWRQIWAPGDGHYARRLFGVAFIAMAAPILLVGLPFVLFARKRDSGKVAVLWTDGPPPPAPPLPKEPPPLPDGSEGKGDGSRYEDRPDQRGHS